MRMAEFRDLIPVPVDTFDTATRKFLLEGGQVGWFRGRTAAILGSWFTRLSEVFALRRKRVYLIDISEDRSTAVLLT